MNQLPIILNVCGQRAAETGGDQVSAHTVSRLTGTEAKEKLEAPKI